MERRKDGEKRTKKKRRKVGRIGEKEEKAMGEEESEWERSQRTAGTKADFQTPKMSR